MRRFLHIVAIGGLVTLALSAAVIAQAPAQQPKPGPEIQKLAYFVGSWKFEGETKASDFGPAGKFSGEETCDWFTGGFQVVCHSNEVSAIGKSRGMSVMAYNAEDKVHTFDSINSRGENFHGSATFTGSTMTITWEGKMGGKAAKLRGTIVQASPTSYTFKMENAIGGGPWVAVGEGKETKVK